MRLISDMVAWSVESAPKWNPINICSYHLQEAGATPVQEMAFALSTAVAVLDEVQASGQVPTERFGEVVGRISFFVNSGMRFVEELSKMRAFASLWDEITTMRYGITDPKLRRFRYGVQVNSLGLTEAQPENNVARIMLELLGVTLSKDARARAVQLPAWNEALGLPRAWDQQWSLRMQQVLAYETDLLEYEDIFAGSHVIEAKVADLKQQALAEMQQIEQLGGMVVAVESGYLKTQLVSSHANRRARIESGAEVVVGLNKYRETEISPLTSNTGDAVLHIDPKAQETAIASVVKCRSERDNDQAARAIFKLITAAKTGANLMPASIECAEAGVTTGEWSDALRSVFGEYRAPTGVAAARTTATRNSIQTARAAVDSTSRSLGHPLRLLVAKPGLDGHSNGAEQVALGARDAGFEVVYQGIRVTSQEIIKAAVQEDVDCVGISILSGSHLEVVPEIVEGLRKSGHNDIPVVLGGIIPEEDAQTLVAHGVSAVFTPKDFDLGEVMQKVVDVIRKENGLAPLGELTLEGSK
jgi:(2R)-ethylmalonyl-CoA mutase